MLHTGFVGSGQTLKLRIWAWGHFMLEHVPNLGDFMDRDERSVVAKILDEKVALQPLDDGKERKWTVRAIHRHVAVCSRLIVLPSTFGICAQRLLVEGELEIGELLLTLLRDALVLCSLISMILALTLVPCEARVAPIQLRFREFWVMRNFFNSRNFIH